MFSTPSPSSHAMLAVLLLVFAPVASADLKDEVISRCRKQMGEYMVPQWSRHAWIKTYPPQKPFQDTQRREISSPVV